ncbi:tRNA lysidine(34) synthetase TilS [Neorhodopirellula pilleata]|uniref:tRNA(Ile)-lysidine synthase n=1 Tax=Neorhodopirellula pilleata TaxID=2714738 RepID=A0A5C6AHL4_9BACT|nr:tRNA lysidine(34) synthetase TilS [Neorhodopirellula pilleata]TWT98910.1 tRNA(Ile)-lysidine synthase [Neorhodopirellula pilleata]
MKLDNPDDCVDSDAWLGLWTAFRTIWTEEADRIGVVVGCSGGADSVALVRLIEAARRQTASPASLVIAHLNHGLRGEDSDRDEAHVRSLAEELGREVVVQRQKQSRQAPVQYDDDPDDRGGSGQRLDSDEASLRQARRRFLVQTAKQHGCRYIALAHTADDQAETVLHHVLRGTGSAGVSGMAISTPIEIDFIVRRPLLNVRRTLVRQALTEIRQTWREDLSNQESRYTRNWIRNEILPAIRQRLPGVDASLIRLAENQSQTDELLTRFGRQWFDAFVSCVLGSDSSRWLRIQTSFDRDASRLWKHDHELARDRAVITRGLQWMFQQYQLPMRDMTQTHWHRLCDLVLKPHDEPEMRSVGHLPGRMEMKSELHAVWIGPIRL